MLNGQTKHCFDFGFQIGIAIKESAENAAIFCHSFGNFNSCIKHDIAVNKGRKLKINAVFPFVPQLIENRPCGRHFRRCPVDMAAHGTYAMRKSCLKSACSTHANIIGVPSLTINIHQVDRIEETFDLGTTPLGNTLNGEGFVEMYVNVGEKWRDKAAICCL